MSPIATLFPVLLVTAATGFEFESVDMYPPAMVFLCLMAMDVKIQPEPLAAHGLSMLAIGMFWVYIYNTSFSGLFALWAVCAAIASLLQSFEIKTD
jgi:hypothetical protein